MRAVLHQYHVCPPTPTHKQGTQSARCAAAPFQPRRRHTLATTSSAQAAALCIARHACLRAQQPHTAATLTTPAHHPLPLPLEVTAQAPWCGGRRHTKKLAQTTHLLMAARRQADSAAFDATCKQTGQQLWATLAPTCQQTATVSRCRRGRRQLPGKELAPHWCGHTAKSNTAASARFYEAHATHHVPSDGRAAQPGPRETRHGMCVAPHTPAAASPRRHPPANKSRGGSGHSMLRGRMPRPAAAAVRAHAHMVAAQCLKDTIVGEALASSILDGTRLGCY
jgi:hypothetical protein